MQITANGIAIEYQEFGPHDGVPMILIRGLGTQMVHWAPEFIQGFAQAGYRTIIFDNRDVGLSQRCEKAGHVSTAADIIAQLRQGNIPAPHYHLTDMAADVIGLMDALGIARAHIFGISMGGGIAQLLAINHADRLLSDTIVMTSARFRSVELLEQLLSYPQSRDEFIEGALQGDRVWGSPGFPVSDDYLRAQAAAAYDRGAEPEGVNRQALATMAAGDRREALKSVNLPCLVIHGAQDTLIPPEAGREIGALIPNAECNVIEGMGHTIPPLLAPKLVEMVDEFIIRRGRA